MSSFSRLSLLLVLVSLVSCKPTPQGADVIGGAVQNRVYDARQVAEGAQLYKTYCASCHGPNAEGDAHWRKRNIDGTFPPPPLNGSGHAWHHSTAVLKSVILDGSAPGQGTMPAWRGKLTEVQIGAVIEWMQSTWPDPVYAAWREMQSTNH